MPTLTDAVADAIDEELAANNERWEFGPPPGISREQLRADRRRVESCRCPECGTRPLRFTPTHCGRVYAPLGTCSRCELQTVLPMRLVPVQKKTSRRRQPCCS